MKRNIEWIEKRKEVEVEKENELMKKEGVEMERENDRIGGENRGMEGEMDRVKSDNDHLKELCPIITSLSEFNLYFSNPSVLNVQDNKITHASTNGQETCVFRDILEPVCNSFSRQIISYSRYYCFQGIHHLFVVTPFLSLLLFTCQYIYTPTC